MISQQGHSAVEDVRLTLPAMNSVAVLSVTPESPCKVASLFQELQISATLPTCADDHPLRLLTAGAARTESSLITVVANSAADGIPPAGGDSDASVTTFISLRLVASLDAPASAYNIYGFLWWGPPAINGETRAPTRGRISEPCDSRMESKMLVVGVRVEKKH